MRSLDRFRGHCNSGAAAIEFAITAPFMLVLVLGVADYGALMNASASLEGATRAIAEYAKNSPQCNTAGDTSWLQGSGCINGINNLVSTLQSNNSSLASATFSPSTTSTTPANYCTCTDGTVVTCPTSGNPCSAKSDPRLLQYIRITATQRVKPLVAYGTYTSAQPLNASTTTRIQ